MKEKELRLAIAYFGGVSLAVYQHGINREILNLVRASKLYHRDREGEDASISPFRKYYPEESDETTGEAYLQFLEAVGRHVSLRVIVDVIAGSSAGGINGITLARALANDLSLLPLTEMWLAEADMIKLLAPEAKARLWSKGYIRPLVRPLLERLKREGLLVGEVDEEMQERVSVFLRSRWFKPPLDGSRLAALVLDGLEAMESPNVSTGSLLPEDTMLDLLVTVTDFRGIDQAISIHDPPVMQEREHRHLFRFSYVHRRTGYHRNDFDRDSLPSLAFAARATASYPGAFPPAQISEIDQLLLSRYRPWPARSHFLAENFGKYRNQGIDPQGAVLVDGSILDNRPIMATLDAIRAHGAFREVDRRLVFVDPHSGTNNVEERKNVPGFFATLRGALSDLPRNDPVYNELTEISRLNRQMRRLKDAVANSRQQVEELIVSATGGRIRDTDNFTIDDVRGWRLNSTRLLSAAPIVYDAWMRTLVLEGVDFIVGLINRACRFTQDAAGGQRTQALIEQWANNQNILTGSYRLPGSLAENADLPAWGKMVLDFGVVYKKRRLHFVLSEVNNLYEDDSRDESGAAHREDLDLIKIKIRKLVDDLAIYRDASFLSDQTASMCRNLFAPASNQMPTDRIPSDAEISTLVDRLGIECDLARRNDDADAVLASSLVRHLGRRYRSAILTAYLGYFYWDVLIRPAGGAESLEFGPIAEVLIDRISPIDAKSLILPDVPKVIFGESFGGFGGFLSRAMRENDYLWGRLHGVDRLFDILATAVPERARQLVDLRALKKEAFERVVREEAGRLSLIPDLLVQIRKAIAAF